MTPVQVVHADARDLGPGQLPEFDHVIFDPPYSPHVHQSATSQSKTRGTRHRDLGFEPLTDELREHLAALAGLARRWRIVYSDHEGAEAWRDALRRHGRYVRTTSVVWEHDEDAYVGTIPWLRWSMPQLSGDRPPTGSELLLVGHSKAKMRWFGPGNLTHFAHKALRGENKHKAEKPLDQALDLVAFFTLPGESVFDPTAGRGTLGVACALLGREYLGLECDADEARQAQDRIEAALDARFLYDRDEERFRRWLESIGWEPGLDFRRLHKGRPMKLELSPPVPLDDEEATP